LEKFKPLQKELRSSLRLLVKVFREKVFVESSLLPPWSILVEAYRMILIIDIHIENREDTWEILERDSAQWSHLGYTYFRTFSALVLDIAQKNAKKERKPEDSDPHIDLILNAFPIILKNTKDPRCYEVFIKEAFFRTHNDDYFSFYRDLKLDELLQMHIENSIWNDNVILILSYLHARKHNLIHPEKVAIYALELLKNALDAARDAQTGAFPEKFDQYPIGPLYKPNLIILSAIYIQYHSWCFDEKILEFINLYLNRFKDKANNMILEDVVKKYVIYALLSRGK
jgi:hypothetical protein